MSAVWTFSTPSTKVCATIHGWTESAPEDMSRGVALCSSIASSCGNGAASTAGLAKDWSMASTRARRSDTAVLSSCLRRIVGFRTGCIHSFPWSTQFRHGRPPLPAQQVNIPIKQGPQSLTANLLGSTVVACNRPSQRLGGVFPYNLVLDESSHG